MALARSGEDASALRAKKSSREPILPVVAGASSGGASTMTLTAPGPS
jgi:hypothetical protein